MQIDSMVIDQITQNIMGVFNKVGETREEAARRVRDVVGEAVEYFNLVSRQEFDVANELLANTRIKLEALEKKVAELEASLATPKNDTEAS
ncbi:MAG: accessory factor UbiK family protein [Magnetococcus sp. DMHC-6]